MVCARARGRHTRRRLRHPHILSALGVSPNPYVHPYLVLQRLHLPLNLALPPPPGKPGRSKAVARWPLSRGLGCGLQLAQAMRYLNDEAFPGYRLLHRDLKPTNCGIMADGRLVSHRLP